MLPLLFVSFSRKKPRQVLLYSAAITGGSCRSLTFRLGAPLRSHLPFTLSLPSQPPGILCNDSRACTLFVTVFLFMTIVYRSIYVCICKVCKFYFFRYFFTSLLSGSAPVLPESPVLSAVLSPCQILRSVHQSVHRCPSRPVPGIFCSSLT